VPKDTVEERVARLARRAGPHVARFTEYLAGEFYDRVRRAALAAGFTTVEAEAIAATTAAGAMKSFASACRQAQYDRNFTRMKS
jgi:hypothetical protein